MALPDFAELTAAAGWRCVDFISDLHLQQADPGTFGAWRRFMASTPADAVFILGDLFEAWPGDDVIDGPGFEADCAAVLREACARRPVFFLHGNRDFLVGEALAANTGVRLLADPAVLSFGGVRWLVSHGDLLCLDDAEYLRFRAQVRSPGWQRDFLSRPLAERQAVARALRARSEDRKRSGTAYADVDAAEARAWLRASGADALIHGHTHRPREHELGDGLRRIVLTDWDLASSPPRAEVLRVCADGGWQRLAQV